MHINLFFTILSLIFSPLLSIRCTTLILPFIILLVHLIPISREYSSTGSLITFDHCSSGILIRSLIDLFEQSIQSCISLRYFLCEIFFNILVYLVPILLSWLSRSRVRWFLISANIWISSHKSWGPSFFHLGPVSILNLFLQFQFNFLQSSILHRFFWNNLICELHDQLYVVSL